MERFGSTKNSMFTGALPKTRNEKPETRKGSPGSSRSFLTAGFWFLLSGFWFNSYRADFVLRDLRYRVLRSDRELVRGLPAGPVVRDEHRVGPDRRHHLRTERDRSAARLHRDPLAVLHAVLR